MQWKLKDNDVAERISDLSSEDKSKDKCTEVERGVVQVHKSSPSEIYGTIQDGRTGRSFRLVRTDGHNWKLSYNDKDKSTKKLASLLSKLAAADSDIDTDAVNDVSTKDKLQGLASKYGPTVMESGMLASKYGPKAIESGREAKHLATKYGPGILEAGLLARKLPKLPELLRQKSTDLHNVLNNNTETINHINKVLQSKESIKEKFKIKSNTPLLGKLVGLNQKPILTPGEFNLVQKVFNNDWDDTISTGKNYIQNAKDEMEKSNLSPFVKKQINDKAGPWLAKTEENFDQERQKLNNKVDKIVANIPQSIAKSPAGISTETLIAGKGLELLSKIPATTSIASKFLSNSGKIIGSTGKVLGAVGTALNIGQEAYSAYNNPNGLKGHMQDIDDTNKPENLKEYGLSVWNNMSKPIGSIAALNAKTPGVASYLSGLEEPDPDPTPWNNKRIFKASNFKQLTGGKPGYGINRNTVFPKADSESIGSFGKTPLQSNIASTQPTQNGPEDLGEISFNMNQGK